MRFAIAPTARPEFQYSNRNQPVLPADFSSSLAAAAVSAANNNISKGTEEQFRRMFRRIVGGPQADTSVPSKEKMTAGQLTYWLIDKHGLFLHFDDFCVFNRIFGGEAFGSLIADDIGIKMWSFHDGKGEEEADYQPFIANTSDPRILHYLNINLASDNMPAVSDEISSGDFAERLVPRMGYPTEDEFIKYIASKERNVEGICLPKDPETVSSKK